MSEEEIIEMIKSEKDYFYREITGVNWMAPSKTALIYLSEKSVVKNKYS